MKIVTTYYDFWREDLVKYFIENTDSSISLTYSLYSVVNSVETLIIEDTIIAGDTASVEFDKEGIYKLYIEDSVETTSYSLKHFPILKQSIIDLMKNAVCCTGSHGCDDTTTENPLNQNLYNTQLLLSSQGVYLHLLLSQSFMRDYRSCFDVTLTDDSKTLISLLQDYYGEILIQGNNTSKSHLLRLYMAYLYILVYTIEMDAASYSEEFFSSQTEETELVEAMFDLENMNTCFNDLNINLTNVMSALDACYKTKPFGSDGVCEELYHGIYWDVSVSPDFPEPWEIANGEKYTADIMASFSVEPNTLRTQYGWFAIPTILANKFLRWEEVGATFNRGTIGSETSTQFIILKNEFVEVNGVEYRVYKFNWSSEFTNTLRLYIS